MARVLLTVGFCVLGAVGVIARRFVRLPDRLHWAIAEPCARSEHAAALLIWLKRAATAAILAGAIGLVWPISWLDPWAPTLAWMGTLVFWMSITTALVDNVEGAIEAGQLAPLFVAIEEFTWKDEWGELAYRDALLEHLHVQLNLPQRHEAPVERGTQVDLRVTHRGVEWFITIKRGINNQKRLTLQGEAEDVLAHVRGRVRNFGILVLLGLDTAQPGKQETHAGLLEKHLMERGAEREMQGRLRSYVLRLVVQAPQGQRPPTLGSSTPSEEPERDEGMLP